MAKLSPKQKLFISEYMVDSNATRAAKEAGYSAKTAKQQGHRLLTNVDIASAIAKRKEKAFKKLDLTAEMVLNELKLLAMSNMQDYLDITPGAVRVELSNLDREKFAAISEVTVEEYVERTGPRQAERVKRTKFKLADKRAALVDLGRHLKLFTDKVEVEGEMKVEVENVKQRLLAKLADRAASSTARAR